MTRPVEKEIKSNTMFRAWNDLDKNQESYFDEEDEEEAASFSLPSSEPDEPLVLPSVAHDSDDEDDAFMNRLRIKSSPTNPVKRPPVLGLQPKPVFVIKKKD